MRDLVVDHQRYSVSTTSIGPDRVSELHPVWAALHEHHAGLEAEGKTQPLGKLRDLESSWRAQRRLYEQTLRSQEAFVILAEAGITAVGYALMVCRRNPLWGQQRFGSLEVLSVLPSNSGSANPKCKISRGHVFHALMMALVRESEQRGLTYWSANVLEANDRVRRRVERLGGKRALVTYRGLFAESAQRLGELRLSRPPESRPARPRADTYSSDLLGSSPAEGVAPAGRDSRPNGHHEQWRRNMTKDSDAHEATPKRETSQIGPGDLDLLKRILRFYPGIEEILTLVRRISKIGYPINSLAALEDGLGGPEVTFKIRGQAMPFSMIKRYLPMAYFPFASEDDLIAKVVELRRRRELSARRSRI